GPRPQVKEGIGPQLPRPKRIRVPTRRELASYGIKLPSQRAAEEKAREAQRNQYDSGDQYNDDEIDAMQQDELARQFATSWHADTFRSWQLRANPLFDLRTRS
ncbi:hypothetical protein ACUOFC_52610, partial [Escherichia sp. TWPC-MK]